MGHYDFCYAFDESYKIELTKDMVEQLEKQVLENGGYLIVFDDTIGVTNIRLASKSKKLSYYDLDGSRWKIYLSHLSKKNK